MAELPLLSYPEAKAGIVDQLRAEARSEFDGRWPIR